MTYSQKTYEEIQAENAAFRNLWASLSVAEKIAHPNFAYARFKPSGLGNYYTIYWRSHSSPTGVESVGGCSESEWETISKICGKGTKYLSPTEKA